MIKLAGTLSWNSMFVERCLAIPWKTRTVTTGSPSVELQWKYMYVLSKMWDAMVQYQGELHSLRRATVENVCCGKSCNKPVLTFGKNTNRQATHIHAGFHVPDRNLAAEFGSKFCSIQPS